MTAPRPEPQLRPCTTDLTPRAINLVAEWVGASAPVGQEHAEADGLEDASQSSDGDSVEGTLLGEDLSDELAVSMESCKSG